MASIRGKIEQLRLGLRKVETRGGASPLPPASRIRKKNEANVIDSTLNKCWHFNHSLGERGGGEEGVAPLPLTKKKVKGKHNIN